jgi:hypothetical protein
LFQNRRIRRGLKLQGSMLQAPTKNIPSFADGTSA